jgi:hypothetical protein
MTNLITFGCSLTYGHGLSDCITVGNGPGRIPSKFAWPTIVGEMLESSVENYGAPGASNLEILHRVLNKTYTKDDIVVIMWTFPDRDLLFTVDYNPLDAFMGIEPNSMSGYYEFDRVGNWPGNKFKKNWICTHGRVDNIMRSWYYIHHAYLFLKSMNVPHYHIFADLSIYNDYKPPFMKMDINDSNIMSDMIDIASDKSHPGPKTHRIVADKIFNIIKHHEI